MNGDGSCNCSSATKVQDYCLDQFGSHSVQYYWRESIFDDWLYKGKLNSISLIYNDNNYYSQYRICGKILLPYKSTQYYFKLLSKTRANIKIGSKMIQDLNSSNCDPSALYTYLIDYGISNSIKTVDFEIIIDTGCPLNQIDVELQWRYSTSFSTIPDKYFIE